MDVLKHTPLTEVKSRLCTALHLRTLAVFLAAISLALPAAAQEWATREYCTISPEAIAAQADQFALYADGFKIPNARGQLREIKSPDGAISHVWGTFHSTEKGVHGLPPTMLKRLRQSHALAVDADTAEYLTPGGLFSLLVNAPCNDFSGGSIPYQDNYIVTLAHIEGLDIFGLEEPTAVMSTLNQPKNLPLAQAMIAAYGAYLQPQFDNTARTASMALYSRGRVGAMMAADTHYLRGVLGPAADIAIDLTNGYPLTERNATFLKSAEDRLEEGGLFIAVGAFHLPGKTGLIELFRNSGYDVTRIWVEGEDE